MTVLLVDADGRLRWRTTGPVSEHSGSELRAALTAGASLDAGAAESLSIEQFEFAFDSQFRPFLALIGVTSGTAHVTLTAERSWRASGRGRAKPDRQCARRVPHGPYHWYKAIGRGSFVDRGHLWHNDSRWCLRVVARPVPGLTPVGPLRHPGITLTLAEPERFVASLRRRAGSRVNGHRRRRGGGRDGLHRSAAGRRSRRGRPSRAMPGPHPGQAGRGTWRGGRGRPGDVLDGESLAAAFAKPARRTTWSIRSACSRTGRPVIGPRRRTSAAQPRRGPRTGRVSRRFGRRRRARSRRIWRAVMRSVASSLRVGCP